MASRDSAAPRPGNRFCAPEETIAVGTETDSTHTTGAKPCPLPRRLVACNRTRAGGSGQDSEGP